jgi:hypothetical protein
MNSVRRARRRCVTGGGQPRQGQPRFGPSHFGLEVDVVAEKGTVWAWASFNNASQLPEVGGRQGRPWRTNVNLDALGSMSVT